MDSPTPPPRRSDRNFAWTAFNAVQFAFTLAWTAAWISAALLVHVVLRNRHWPLRMAARCWAPGLLWGAGARLQVSGLEQVDWSRNHVFVANHQSTIDICALFRAVPVPLRFLLKQEMTKVPFVGWYRSEEHTSELQSLMRISYAVFCLKKKHTNITTKHKTTNHHNTKTI